jgi:hypothetical protein
MTGKSVSPRELMSSVAKFLGFLCAWSVAITILLVIAAIIYFRFGPALCMRSDKYLATLLRDHRGAFERLRTMTTQDAAKFPLVTLTNLNTPSLSKDRRDEYRQLIASIGQNAMMISSGQHEALFTFPSLLPGRGMKQIAYVEDGEMKYTVVPTLDKPPPRKPGVYVVPIESNWYILYNNED